MCYGWDGSLQWSGTGWLPASWPGVPLSDNRMPGWDSTHLRNRLMQSQDCDVPFVLCYSWIVLPIQFLLFSTGSYISFYLIIKSPTGEKSSKNMLMIWKISMVINWYLPQSVSQQQLSTQKVRTLWYNNQKSFCRGTIYPLTERISFGTNNWPD